MLNSTPFKRRITVVAAMKMARLLMDLKPHHKIILSYPMDRLYRLSQWSYQKLWWVAKVVGLVAWKLFLLGDESTHPWHQSVYTQIFLLIRHAFSSLDSLSYRQSQSNITGYSDDSSRYPGRFPCLCCYSHINSFWKWIQFILEQTKTICWKTQKHKNTESQICRVEKTSLIVIWLVKLQVNS